MRTASAHGLAVLLPAVPGYSRHHGVWWAQAEHGDWLEVTDPDIAERLEAAARALHTADAAVTRSPRARSADSSNTEEGGGPRHDHRQGIEDELGPNAADEDAKS
jgi:hypothetical protein